MYMIMDYCNGMDLQVLLRVRKKLTQIETARILS
jgi:serine/threonine protein kinase